MRKIIKRSGTVVIALVFLASCLTAYAGEKEVLLKLARVLSYQKKYDESLARYDEYLKKYPNDYQAHLEAGDVSFWKGDYDRALHEYEIAENDPKLKAQAQQKKAEILAIKKGYKKSIAEYDRVLDAAPDNVEALRGKADVLSWDQRFDESIETYNKLLEIKYDADAARQKARVLGWARRYGESIKAYREAYERTGNEAIDLEGKAKKAYWNRWVLKAIKLYEELLDIEPDNIEARFDLAQIEAYERMWSEAAGNFEFIVKAQPDHFRASESLDKVRLLWKKRSLTPYFRWFRANSDDRSTDINRFTTGGEFFVPFHQAVALSVAYNFDFFKFRNAGSIPRHQGKIGLNLSFTPRVWLDASYLPTGYPTDNRMSHLFEASVSGRPFNPVIVTAFVKRDDLFNQRIVFDKKLRSTDFGGKIQADIHRRWTAFADYRYRMVNDDNHQNTFGIENLVFLLYEPRRLTVDVRFDFQDWKRTITDYWSPQNFWHVITTFHWRHYLNPNGLYFGAKNTYYGIKYRFQIDKDKKPFNGGAVEFHRDWSRIFSTHLEGFGDYSTEYWDVGAMLNATVRF